MPEKDQFEVYVGIDWATEEHQVCIAGADGQVIRESKVAHDANAIHELVEGVIEYAGGQATRVAVGIEVPHGALVETLVDRGIVVFAINPKKLDRFRDRFTVAGAKDDRRDARVLADSLRTDRAAFTRVVLGEAHIIELREETHIHEELTEQFVQVSNRLRDQFRRFYPQMLKAGDPTEAWLWELWEMAPSPQDTPRLEVAAVERLLKRHRIRRCKADQVCAVLQSRAFSVGAGVVSAACRHIEVLVAQLRVLHQQRRQSQRRLRALLKRCAQQAQAGDSEVGPPREHSDAEILLSMPGVGDFVGATMLAEAAGVINNRELNTLRALGGSAPVTKRSGKMILVVRRYACSRRLSRAFYHWGMGAISGDEHSRQHYGQLRSRGCSHGRAIRGVVDRLLSVSMAMLRDGTLYDATRRRALAAVA
jgi:transposase